MIAGSTAIPDRIGLAVPNASGRGRLGNGYSAGVGPAIAAKYLIWPPMLKTRIKRLANTGERAVQRLAQIQASIVGLKEDDLLDLADIFKGDPDSPLGEIAQVEMTRRNLSL